jgi:hypothetical protein
MKKTTAILLLFSTAAFLSIYVGCNSKKSGGEVLAIRSSRLPTNVFQSCTLPQDSFNTWFAGGKAVENGLVMPANSVTFGHNNNCDFYKWSWQMFAWITSPLTNNKYGSGNTVLESQVFYTVSPANAAGNRVLIPHTPGSPLRVTSSIPQLGPHKLPTIMDKQGHLFEVEKPATTIKPMLLSGTQRTTISQVEVDAAGKAVFKDQAGKVIVNPKAMILTKGNTANIVQEFKATNGRSVFVGANGPIETEEGQAGGGHGLMAQNGSLVYYITMVNDVFAYYLSGAKNGLLSDSLQFPITAAARDSICAVAKANGNKTLPDSNALAMEFKTSWIEASKVPDPQNYITIDAVIPTYSKTDTLWTPTDSATVKLVLVGVHVVGSTAGHPEMVWATFEHNQNAPNATYQYLNGDSVLVNQPADSSGKFTFSSNPLDPSPNQSHFIANDNTLIAESPFTISPSNSQMSFPWGSEPNVSPNKEDGSSAASNSEVLSINNSILGMLVGNDIRKNYVMIGATWTSGGNPPTGTSYSTNPGDPGAAIGTSLLANITMETYKQSNQNSCFTCHRSFTTPDLYPANLSHVYGGIIPLFSVSANK